MSKVLGMELVISATFLEATGAAMVKVHHCGMNYHRSDGYDRVKSYKLQSTDSSYGSLQSHGNKEIDHESAPILASNSVARDQVPYYIPKPVDREPVTRNGKTQTISPKEGCLSDRVPKSPDTERRIDIVDTQKEAGAVIRPGQGQAELVTAYIMEAGMIFHSIIIGVGLGVITKDKREVQILTVALCIHQFFEGIGLATCIIDAKLSDVKTAIMLLAFSFTTPLGTVIGILVSSSYTGDTFTSTLIQGVLNALAAGVLLHLAFVDLIAVEFNKPICKEDPWFPFQMLFAIILGAAIMSVLAIWA